MVTPVYSLHSMTSTRCYSQSNTSVTQRLQSINSLTVRTASTQLPIHTLVIKGNITSLSRTRDQTVATLYNVHANVNSMTNRGSSQPGESINQIISQIIQRDRSAVDDHSADIFGDDRRLFTSPTTMSDTGQQQSSSGTIPETGNNATSQLDSRGEFEALQLLTQYIGRRKPNPVQTNRHRDPPPISLNSI